MPKAPSSTPDYTRPKAFPFCGEKLLIVFFEGSMINWFTIVDEITSEAVEFLPEDYLNTL